MFAKYAPEEMPDQMLAPDQIDEILELIEKHSRTKKPFVPTSGRLKRRPVPKDVPAGMRLFTGQTKLAKGGSACIACHGATGVGSLGGGSLGPDLTDACRRYTEVELASILKSPAFPTMSKLFANHKLSDEEVVRLYAYLHSIKVRPLDQTRASGSYMAVSAAGMLAVFGAMSLAWRRRLRHP
jgi:mono/diheme cytochrome c family protein